MRRREFIVAVGGAAVALSMAARAQTAGVKRVGVVYQGGGYERSIEGLREGLRAVGLEEGQHVALLLRNVRGDAAAAEAAARALERDEKVDVIVAIGTTTARAAKRATVEVPIVFAAGTDPVQAGLVESIATPGGRLTGFHFLTVDLTAKRLEMLREIVPKASSPSTTRALRAQSRAWRGPARRPRSWTLRWWRNRSPPPKSSATVCAL